MDRRRSMSALRASKLNDLLPMGAKYTHHDINGTPLYQHLYVLPSLELQIIGVRLATPELSRNRATHLQLPSVWLMAIG
jgi:hypothetical protein